MEEHNVHFVHASDEWYMLAKRSLPEEETYDEYLQLENGVGMMKLLMEEFKKEFFFLPRTAPYTERNEIRGKLIPRNRHPWFQP